MAREETTRLSLYRADGQRKYFTPAERQRFLAVANNWPDIRTATLCLMVAYTGCRISEALAITPRSIDIADEFVVIRSLKKRGLIVMREVPLPSDYVRLLTLTFDFDNDDPLWPIGRSWGWHQIKRVMTAATIGGGPHATPKGLRHGFAIHALRSGVPITLVKRWLGHSRISTTEIYLDVIGPEERAFAERMWDRT